MKRIALKCGRRTAFVKMDAQFARMNAVDLSCALINGMLETPEVPVASIQHVVWGMVVPDPNIYSIAREAILGSKLDNRVEGYSLSRACATSLQCTTNAVSYYNSFPDEKSATLVGGVESFSSVRPVLQDATARYFRSLGLRGGAFSKS